MIKKKNKVKFNWIFYSKRDWMFNAICTSYDHKQNRRMKKFSNLWHNLSQNPEPGQETKINFSNVWYNSYQTRKRIFAADFHFRRKKKRETINRRTKDERNKRISRRYIIFPPHRRTTCTKVASMAYETSRPPLGSILLVPHGVASLWTLHLRSSSNKPLLHPPPRHPYFYLPSAIL